jgi:hypothetical protein
MSLNADPPTKVFAATKRLRNSGWSRSIPESMIATLTLLSQVGR